MDSVVSLKGICKTFDREILKNIDLEVKPGELLLIAGFNGIGKSTLLDILTGVGYPDEGHVRISPDVKMGYMTNSDTFYDHLTAYDFIRFHTDYQKVPAAEADELISNFLNRYNMTQIRDSLYKGLSTGERRRLKFCASIAHSPSLLVLDEPFGNLDIKQILQLGDHLEELKERGTTIVIVSHTFDVLPAFVQ